VCERERVNMFVKKRERERERGSKEKLSWYFAAANVCDERD